MSLTNIDKVISFSNQLAVYRTESARSFIIGMGKHTGVLDTVLRQDTMTPVADAADSLHTTCPMRRSGVCHRVLLFLGEPLGRNTVEPLLKLPSHPVPLLAVRVADDRLVRESIDVMWKREPVVASGGDFVGIIQWTWEK